MEGNEFKLRLNSFSLSLIDDTNQIEIFHASISK